MESYNKHISDWFEAIFAGVEESVIIVDDDFVIGLVNPAAEKLFGCRQEQLQGKSFTSLLDPAWNKETGYVDFLNGQLAGLDEVTSAAYWRSPANQELFLKTRIRKVKNAEGNTGYLIFLVSLENESPGTREIIENERKYHKLFESAIEGIFILNNEGYIIDANPASCEIYRAEKDQVVGLHVSDIFPHQAKDETDQIWQNFIQTGYLEGFYKYVLENGDSRYIEFKSKTNFLPGLHLAVFSDVTEKTKTAKALRRSEANLKAIFNHTRQQFILLDTEKRIVTFNEAAQQESIKNLGRPLEVGHYIYEYGDTDDNEKYDAVYKSIAAGESLFIETNPGYFLAPDKWIEVGFIPIFDYKKVFKGTLLSVSDISARKQAEIHLQESEARFRSLVQNSSDIITILDTALAVKYASASLEKILGYKEKELTGKSILTFIHEDDRNAVKKILERIVQGEEYLPVLEYRFLHAEGYYVYLETACNNLVGNEYIKGIILNTRDVTERKYQEENLLLLERAIDSSSNGILISDPNQPDNPIVYANRAFEQITGYNYFDIIGRNCRFLQGDDRSQPEIEKMRNAISEQKEVKVIVRNYRKDGSLFWNQLSISPVVNRDKVLTNYIGVITDITDRKTAEEALLQISEGVSSSPDHNIFKPLVTHIGLRLGMDLVMVGEFSGKYIRTIAFWQDGEIKDNFDYPVEHTPCEEVLQRGHCIYYSNASEKFPEDKIVVSEKVQFCMGVPLKDSQGKVMGLLAVMSRKIFHNIQLAESILNIFSVRASAEFERGHYVSALKASEERFKDLAKNSPDIIYIIDLEIRRVVYFNRKEILGYPDEELSTSEQWESIVHPLDVEMLKEHWKNFLQSKENLNQAVEYRVRNKSGVYEWVANRHIVIDREADGTPRQVLLNITVVTERKKTEEALRESEARLVALVENTNDIVWSVDRSYVFTAMNASFRNLLKHYYETEVRVGDNLMTDIPAALREEWIPLLKKTLKGERFSVEFNVKGKHDENSFEISYNPIYSDKGRISGVSVFGRDITQRKLAENDIIRTNFELDSFVYRASHDLRAPLRSVLGLVNLAKAEENEKERNTYLYLVEKSVNKLDTFISDLTNFSRNSRLEVTVSRIDFGSIIEDCLENLKYMDNADRIRTIVQVQGDGDFYSDKTRIGIIFQNIISNAIKYQNLRIEDPYVKIEISISHTHVSILISDNGKGIKEEYLDKIFNMFFRASQESYGSGLGLYITKQVVEKLHGTISVQSELGSGTTFNIRLPNLH